MTYQKSGSLATACCCFFFAAGLSAQPQVVASYNFSDGGVDGWAPYGTATLANAVPPVLDPNSDANALLVTGRTDKSSGPGVSLLGAAIAEGTYQITAYVLLQQSDSANTAATLSVNIANCSASGGSTVNVATAPNLSTSAWVKLQGTFRFSNLPVPPSDVTLFVQSSSATASFYLGAVTMTQLAAPPAPSLQDNSGVSTGFEDGGLDGWTSRSGSSTLTNSTAAAHSGSSSLLVANRVANWDGPQLFVNGKMFYGSRYAISAWVQMQNADGQKHTINMSMQLTLAGVISYPYVTQITVPGDGQWHSISVPNYAVPQAFDDGSATASIYFQTAGTDQTPLAPFYLDDVTINYLPQPVVRTDVPSMYQTYSSYFPIGAAIVPEDITGIKGQLLAQHYNSLVSGNDMKWSSVEPSKGVYNYANADAQVRFATCNAMKIRGHNLVWANGSQTPSYAYGDGTNSAANQATVTANIQEHIQNEVSHFGSSIYVWDVVNEPFDASQSDCLVHGPFYKVLGKSYIDIALNAARQYAPPDTKLFLNDYSTADPARVACIVKVVGDLRSRGIPIDGIGHETHNAIDYPSTSAMISSINTIADTFPGIDQQITELDESVYRASQLNPVANCVASDFNVTNGGVVPPAVIAEQGWLYKQYFDAFRQVAGKISAVTIWGLSDDTSWLNSFPCVHLDPPLPFDANLQPKPAFWGIVDPTQLPGAGLTLAVTGQADDPNTGGRVWTITATNPGADPAFAVTMNGFTLTSSSCKPVVKPPSQFPISLDDVAGSGGTASVSFLIDFTSCSDPAATFSLSLPWTSAVYQTGTLQVDGLSR